jgi:hypothetical protein
MHRTRLIVSTIALLAIASFAVADSPRRGAVEASAADCPAGGGACQLSCGPCPQPCPAPCATGEMAQVCAVGADDAAH